MDSVKKENLRDIHYHQQQQVPQHPRVSWDPNLVLRETSGKRLTLKKESYLTSRRQYVQVDAKSLSILTTTFGVPQGSIQFYSPTSDASTEELEYFYDILQETLDSIPNRDIKVLMGDANAKTGRTASASATHGKYGLGESNEQSYTQRTTNNKYLISATSKETFYLDLTRLPN